jgi:hypothetical protein
MELWQPARVEVDLPVASLDQAMMVPAEQDALSTAVSPPAAQPVM